MSYDAQETTNHQICEIRFLATNEEANDVWLQLSRTPEWQEFDAVDNMLRYGNWNLQPAPTEHPRIIQELKILARRQAELRSTCGHKVRELVRAKGLIA